MANKIAPCASYRALEVARALTVGGHEGDVALYDGNDDNIVVSF